MKFLMLIFTAGFLVFCLTGCSQKSKLPAPIVLGPDNGFLDSTYRFFALMEDSASDSISIRFSWGDGTASDWTIFGSYGDTFSMVHSWSRIGTYSVKAQARNLDNEKSEWSKDHLIIISQTENSPPNTPAKPDGPAYGYVDSIYYFSARAFDPDSDSVSIRFSWGDNNISFWSDYFPSGYTITLFHSWKVPGIYYINAQAKDQHNAVSNWSERVSIEIYDME